MHRWLVLALIAGCYDPSVGLGGACGVDGACPAGQMCFGGRCLLGPPGEDAAGDTMPGDATDAPNDVSPDTGPSPTWLPPTPIPGVNTAGVESDPSLTANRLTIVFQRNGDLYLGVRSSVSAAFTVAPLQALNSSSNEASPEISPDGLTIYFSSDRAVVGNRDIYRSTFANGSWSPPVLDPNLTTAADDADVGIAPDGLTAFVAAGTTLLRSTRATTASAWGTPSSTNTAWGVNPSSPSLDQAGDVYLHANNPRDLFVSRHGQIGYATPTAISELNTLTRDAAPFISADELYMAFERDGDLYETHR